MPTMDRQRLEIEEHEEEKQRAVERSALAQHEDAQWEPSAGGRIARIAVLSLIVAFVLASPHFVRDDLVGFVIDAGIFAIVALSMNILMGYAGQISLGHAAFYGIGAFISGVVVSQVLAPAGGAAAAQPVVEGGGLMAQIDPLFRFTAGLLMAGLAGAVAALGLGAVALRLRGLYLALVTIAYGALAENTLFKLPVFGGGAGIQAPRPPLFEGDISYAYLVFAFVAVFLFLDWRLTSSRAGRAIQALRDDERVAASWGINVTGFKLLAFVLSGILAGIAGGLFAHKIGAVNSTEFTLQVSLIFVLMTVIGGLGNRWGVIQGGVVFAVLGRLFEWAAQSMEGAGIHPGFKIPFTTTEVAFGPTWEPMVASLLLILTLMFFPGGIAEQQEHLLRWLSFKRFLGPEDEEAGGAHVRP
ncbi:MAG: branched-chain amino acid ABC transporter permease [Actinobacteria bacterium]|nr:branched-chain amino acid ABC transporter permease [Actinomycetota bacterium]